MVILWWVIFLCFVVLIPAVVTFGKMVAFGNATIVETRLYLILQGIGILAGASVAFIFDINWWWSIIFSLLAFYSATLSLIISVIGVWLLWALLVYASGVTG